jgi:hypothetical protein
MARVVTASGSLSCVHGGTFLLTPSQSELSVAGAPVLVVTDLTTATIVGCQNKPKPCLKATGLTAPGSAKLAVAGTAVVLETTAGTTDFGTFSVLAPGQNILEA